MYKAHIDLGRVNPQISVKFNMVLEDPDDKTRVRLVNKFVMRGNTYLAITPHPWISIDIGGRRRKSDDEYDPNNVVSLTRPYVVTVSRMLERAIASMETKDLFFYRNGELCINKELAGQKCLFKTTIKNSKYIAMCPVVINDGQDQYEGLGLLINSTANAATMTLDEAEYLLNLLRNVDMYTLSMQVINSAMLLKDAEARKIVMPQTLPVEVEQIDDRRLLPNKGDKLPDIK